METKERQAYINDESLSYSGLKMLEVSPAHYRAYKDRLLDKPPTPALIFGGLFDKLMLKADEFNKKVAVYSHPYKRGVVWTEFQNRHKGKQVVSPQDFHKLYCMRHALLSKKTASAMLGARTTVEPYLYWEDPKFKIKCKACPDLAMPDIRVLGDLKTCISLDKNKLERDIYNYRYHWQALWCLNGINNTQELYYNQWVWIFIEKAPPFEVRFLKATQSMLDKAREEIGKLLETYVECLDTNTWLGFPDEIEDAYLPAWA